MHDGRGMNAPAEFGARFDGRGTRYRVWAPSVAALSLQVEGREAQAMHAIGDGFFELDTEDRPGARYRYRLADGTLVPDPAARAQAGDVDDASLVVDPRHDWQHADWHGRPWAESVIYEMHAGLLGGFVAATAQLPRLATLGITVIELMPVADFAGQRNWGYDGVLPFAPDASLGTPAELKQFVDTAHGLGLSVMLDVVYNHFGPAGNHLHRYAEPFFKKDAASGWGAGLDFDQPNVRRFFIANALYWLSEFRFDGLRLDAVHAIGHTGFLRELEAAVRQRFALDRHVHLVLENEHNDARLLKAPAGAVGYDAQWNDDFHNALHVLLTGEREGYYANYADDPLRHLLRALREGFAYQGEPSAKGEPRGTPSGHLSPLRFVNFVQNHDQIGNRAHGERLTALVPPEAVHAAQALLLLSPGIPLIFMGEEVDSTTPFLFFTDFDEPLATAVREGRAREFETFEAFKSEGARPIPDPNACSTFEASIPTEPPHAAAARERLRTLLALRREYLVPHLEHCRCVEAMPLGARAFRVVWQLDAEHALRRLCNLGPQAVEHAEPLGGRLLYCSAGGKTDPSRLPPFSTLVERVRQTRRA